VGLDDGDDGDAEILQRAARVLRVALDLNDGIAPGMETQVRLAYEIWKGFLTGAFAPLDD
jgi:hypothetical protein